MGVKQFFTLFEGKKITLDQLKGQTIAVDCMTEIYRASLAMPNALTDDNGNVTTHINIIVMNIAKFKKAGINQIYVFDGVAPLLKGDELERRKVLKEKMIANVGDMEPMMAKYAAFKVTNVIIEEIKKILILSGISFIVAPDYYDAEHICAELNRTGIVDHILTTDADALIYGGNSILKYEKRVLVNYTRSGFKETTKLNDEQMIKVAIVLGTDFNKKTPRVGPKTVIQKIDDIKLTDEQTTAVAHFKKNVVVPHIKQNTADIPALLEWLVSRGFNRARMAKLLIM